MNKSCPRCKRAYRNAQQHDPRHKTRDHILPMAWGAGAVLYGDVNNIAFMCADCNSFRALAFDCWAMAACIDAVRGPLGLTRRQMFKHWKLGPALQEHKDAAGRIVSAPAEKHRFVDMRDRRARRHTTADAVAIGRIVDRLGPDKFMWPADTLEAQLHNYEVLIGAGYKPPTKESEDGRSDQGG